MFEKIDNIRQTASATLQYRMAFSFAKMLIKWVLTYIVFYVSALSHTQKKMEIEIINLNEAWLKKGTRFL